MLGLESKYAYAMGRARALETRLLDRGRLDRMVDSPDLEGALKVLAEVGYARAQLSERARPAVEDVIAAEEEKLVAIIRETTPEPGLLEFVTARWDFHNLKVMLKAKLHRVAPEKAIARLSTVDAAAIERAIDGDSGAIALHLFIAIEAAKAAHALRSSPDSIDIAIDREMYRHLLTRAEALRIPFLVELIRREIDLFNLGVFFRAGRMGIDRALLARALAPRGRIDITRLIASYGQRPEAALESVAGMGYEAVVRGALDAAAGKKPLLELERVFDADMWEHIRRARYVPLGPEPLVGYMFAKMHELKLARLVLAGKASGMSRDSMRERLRDVIA